MHTTITSPASPAIAQEQEIEVDESSGGEYRIIIVKSAVAANFDVTTANALATGSYTSVEKNRRVEGEARNALDEFVMRFFLLLRYLECQRFDSV